MMNTTNSSTSLNLGDPEIQSSWANWRKKSGWGNGRRYKWRPAECRTNKFRNRPTDATAAPSSVALNGKAAAMETASQAQPSVTQLQSQRSGL